MDQNGDLDHFRPKGKLTDRNHKPILIEAENGENIPHPGYYWLAYDYSNLIPSCILCNRPSKNNEGIKIGKWDQFPVKGKHAYMPGDEVNEEPLLINPIFENPDDHLEIDELGIIHAKDEKGEKCIEIFGLNVRQALIFERKKTYENVKDKLRLSLLGSKDLTEIPLYKIGALSYSISARKSISDFKVEIQNYLASL